MEARNFVTAREMVEKGNWLLPTLNGQPRYAKPPLPTWITAAMAKISGDIHWVGPLRIPSSTIAVVGLVFMFLLVRKITDNEDLAFYTTLILATSFYYNYLGKIATWDIYCHGFMLAAIFYFYKGLQGTKGYFKFFVITGVLFGLSFMSKGPISFYTVLIPFLVGYVFTFKFQSIKRHWLGIAASAVIATILAGAWPLYTYFQDSETLLSITSHEVKQWSVRHTRPFWYYLNFPVQAGAWALLIIPALIYPYMKTRVSSLKHYKLALLWFLAALFLLSVVPEKKDRYLMPALIPLAWVVSFYVEYLVRVIRQGVESGFDRASYYVNLGLFTIVSMAAPILYFLYGYQTEIYGLPAFILIAILYFGLVGYMLGAFRKRNAERLFHGVVLSICLLNLFGLALVRDYQLSNPIYKSIEEVRNNSRLREMKFATLGEINPIYVWEAGKEVEDISLSLNKLKTFTPFALFTLENTEQLRKRPEFSDVQIQHLNTFYPGLKPEPEYFLYIVRGQ